MTEPTNLLPFLTDLYGEATGQQILPEITRLIDDYRERIPAPRRIGIHSGDAMLITYADQVREEGLPPLQTLGCFCQRTLSGVVSSVHLLPFYPYSSDDGFSVIDYRRVNADFGDWPDLAPLRQNFRLMFDAVINHISAQSAWFLGFLKDDPQYRDYFIVVPEGADVSQVVRPRALPLLTAFQTPTGEKKVWTTFSADQIDLNYRSPALLLEVLSVLLLYVAQGAEFIRLDAIAFLWKEYGTRCLHLFQTHRVIQLIRAVLDEVAPHVALITETNVPHLENLSYFGDGIHEAQMVYNFALPPLTLHTFHTGSALALSQWAGGLSLPSEQVTFFNFLASHDGVGLNPARGILSDAEIDAVIARVQAHGGLVSYKNNPDGSSSPYELNINYFDALSDPAANETLALQVDRFMAAQAIMLALVGVPGIYFHSLFGSRGWREGVELTGQNRTINREKCTLGALERELADPTSRRAQVFGRYSQLLKARAAHPAFDPHGTMRVIDAGAGIFGVLRTCPGSVPVLCLHNVSARTQTLNLSRLGLTPQGSMDWDDILSQRMIPGKQDFVLEPYQVSWLTPRS